VGRNRVQTAPPGGTVRYRWYAGDVREAEFVKGEKSNRIDLISTPIEYGGTNLVPADKIKQGQKSLVAALVVEPTGSVWREDANRHSAASVGPDANGDGQPDSVSFRDFTTVWQKQLGHRYADGTAVENIDPEEGVIAEDSQDSGHMAINYGSEPLWFRFGLRPNAPLQNEPGGLGAVPNAHQAYSNTLAGGDPVTPVFTAAAGQQTRLRLLQPHGNFRGSTFRLHGHQWQRDPYVCPGSAYLGLPGLCTPTDVASQALGLNPIAFYRNGQEGLLPYTHYEILLPSAGGINAVPGDYLFRDYESLGNTDGQWGILRVQRGTWP